MKKNIKYILYVIAALALLLFAGKRVNLHPSISVGERIDSLDGVYVYYNGGVSHSGERDTAEDGYNIGIKYQCVEFVKRYYYVHYQHKMPDSYGNAKDFFDSKLADGDFNAKRALVQYSNPSRQAPQQGDLLVYTPTLWNRYGHVAIIASVRADSIEIIQQNAGPFSSSRDSFALVKQGDTWHVQNDRILGWLRKRPLSSSPEIQADHI